jgi:hypothetical protein
MLYYTWLEKRNNNKEYWAHIEKHNLITNLIDFVIRNFSKNNNFISTHCFKLLYYYFPNNKYKITDIQVIMAFVLLLQIIISINISNTVIVILLSLLFIALQSCLLFAVYHYSNKNKYIKRGEKKEWLVLELSKEKVVHRLSDYIHRNSIEKIQVFEIDNVLKDDNTITDEYIENQLSLYKGLDYDNRLLNFVCSFIQYPILKACAMMYFNNRYINLFFDILRDINILFCEKIINRITKLFNYTVFSELNPCVSNLCTDHLFAEKLGIFKLDKKFYIKKNMNINDYLEITTQDLYNLNVAIENNVI